MITHTASETSIQHTAPRTPIQRRLNSRSVKESIAGITFSLPAILGCLIFTLAPMIASLIFSLTDFTGFSTPKFVGFDNYVRMFSENDLYFKPAAKATLYYTILNVPASIIFSFALALILNNEMKCRSIFRAIYYLPSIIPVVATSMVWLWILNPDFGLVNSVLESIGLPKGQWLFGEKSVVPTIVITGLWATGQTMVIFLAGLQGVPKQYYEAIDVDGGNSFHKLINITIPMMTPTIFFNTVMAVINSFQVFTQAFVMTDGGPNNASLFYVFYLYREGFRRSQMGYASALAFVLFLTILVFTVILFKTQKMWVYYEGGE